MARTMAQSVDRLVRGELHRTRRKTKFTYLSFCSEPDPKNLAPHIGFFAIGLGASDPAREISRVTFVPTFVGGELPQHAKPMQFAAWWAEPIFIEGAGGANGLIPLEESKQIKFDKRKRITRNTLINRTRNEVGAHFDEEVSDEFAFAWSWGKLVSLGHQWPSGNDWNIDDHPEHFELVNTPADAMIRMISEEIVRSAKGWDWAQDGA